MPTGAVVIDMSSSDSCRDRCPSARHSGEGVKVIDLAGIRAIAGEGRPLATGSAAMRK